MSDPCRETADEQWAHSVLARLPVVSADCQEGRRAIRARIAALGRDAARPRAPRLLAIAVAAACVLAVGTLVLRARVARPPSPRALPALMHPPGTAPAIRNRPVAEPARPRPQRPTAARVAATPRRLPAPAPRHAPVPMATRRDPPPASTPPTAAGDPSLARFFNLPPPDADRGEGSSTEPGFDFAEPDTLAALAEAEAWERLALAVESIPNEPVEGPDGAPCPNPPFYEAQPRGQSHSGTDSEGGWS